MPSEPRKGYRLLRWRRRARMKGLSNASRNTLRSAERLGWASTIGRKSIYGKWPYRRGIVVTAAPLPLGPDIVAAEEEFKRAIEPNAGYGSVHHWYAFNLLTQGRADEALEEARRAQELDPLSFVINTLVGFV